MERYSVIEKKNPREIVLIKGRPCKWGKCAFCDYILDNSLDTDEMDVFNNAVLKCVTGKYGKLEVINSGSVFELTENTLKQIRETVRDKKIEQLYFESHYQYKHRLREIEDYFSVPMVFKCGIETFDHDFRNRVLNKGVVFKDPKEVAGYFQSVCLMVGIMGQTKEMVQRDIEILLDYFPYGCINLYVNNSTHIKADPALAQWFKEEYTYLEDLPNIEILWHNTDFGVGGNEIENFGCF